MERILNWISRDSRHRFALSLVAAAGTFISLRPRLSGATTTIATWDAFAICVLALVWVTIFITPQAHLRAHAKAQDLSRALIFGFVVIAACAALFAVAFLIRAHRVEMPTSLPSHVLLALGTVAISWVLLHTVFSLHYAHIFYGDNDERNADAPHAGGLKFPGSQLPDYSDFAYFSFVIGMTCQVSDVDVTSRRMRQMTLIHGILSFGYNTVILALLVNTVSGLL